MQDVDRQFQAAEGMDVVDADGEKVGKVVAVRPSHVVVEKGFFFPTEFFIPRSAIAKLDGHVHLNVTRDDALTQGWGDDPAGTVDSESLAAAILEETAAPTAGGTSIPTGGGGQWLGDPRSGIAERAGGENIPGRGGADWLGDSGGGAEGVDQATPVVVPRNQGASGG